MAHQDVRYYLNGLLLEVGPKTLKAVATDGHRLAMAEYPVPAGSGEEIRQLIIPRKGVAEMLRLATQSGEAITLSGSNNQIRVLAGKQSLTVKLVDGKFPDYERVIPRNGDKLIFSNREQTKAALQRTSILSNEKFRGVRLNFTKDALKASTHNPEQEEAEEDIEIEYQGEPLEIGFNVSYLLDVLNVLGSEKVQISLSDPNSSCLIQAAGEDRAKYVVMPMRL
jgi:DNA polymerase-3 subunit beta